MANAAMTQLDQQIKVIRQEAYDAGYAAAMQAIREFVGSSSGTAATWPARKSAGMRRPRKTTTKTRSRRPTATAKVASRQQPSRPPRGSNALMIAEVLRGMRHSTRAADIRRALQRDKGISISFPSIRHALDQLAQRGEVEASADHKTWRYARLSH
jgi:hypothetical protein